MDPYHAQMEVNASVKMTVSTQAVSFFHTFGSAMCKLETLLITATAYAQCRQQIDGSWTPDPSWQCQQPGSSPTGSLNSNTAPAGDTSSGGGTGTVPANQDNTSPNTNSGSTTPSDGSSQSSGGGGGSQAATIGDCTTASPPGGWDGVASTSVSA